MGSKNPTQPSHFQADYPESGSNSDDDNAAEISEYADGLSIEARLEAELRDVGKALSAVDQGTYGASQVLREKKSTPSVSKRDRLPQAASTPEKTADPGNVKTAFGLILVTAGLVGIDRATKIAMMARASQGGPFPFPNIL